MLKKGGLGAVTAVDALFAHSADFAYLAARELDDDVAEMCAASLAFKYEDAKLVAARAAAKAMAKGFLLAAPSPTAP